MSRVSVDTYLKLDRLACPACRGEFHAEGDLLACAACGCLYPVADGIPVLQPRPRGDGAERKEEIQRFWGELYRAAYAEHPEEHEPAAFLALLDELERMFVRRQHLAVTEMPIGDLKGRAVLEIGSGAGAHAALFAARGAEVTAMDITIDRVVATARKLDWVDTGGHFALQADAEELPFKGDRFDIVYSNGVLHHTPDTALAVDEVHRVLKPGGNAVVMLYARHSFEYWVNLFLLHGLVQGARFAQRDWLGRATEWMACSPQRVWNPETKVFSAREVRRLFGRFREVRIRKNSFTVGMALSALTWIPRVGPRVRSHMLRLLERWQGLSRGGILVYGAPVRVETRSELALGRWIGFGLNILAVK